MGVDESAQVGGGDSWLIAEDKQHVAVARFDAAADRGGDSLGGAFVHDDGDAGQRLHQALVALSHDHHHPPYRLQSDARGAGDECFAIHGQELLRTAEAFGGAGGEHEGGRRHSATAWMGVPSSRSGLPLRCSSTRCTSATMARAISSGVSPPRSRPMGLCNRSRKSTGTFVIAASSSSPRDFGPSRPMYGTGEAASTSSSSRSRRKLCVITTTASNGVMSTISRLLITVVSHPSASAMCTTGSTSAPLPKITSVRGGWMTSTSEPVVQSTGSRPFQRNSRTSRGGPAASHGPRRQIDSPPPPRPRAR